MSVVDGKRLPCEQCGKRLYYNEQRERWCRACASGLGVERMCDHGATRWTDMDVKNVLDAIEFAGELPVAERWRAMLKRARPDLEIP